MTAKPNGDDSKSSGNDGKVGNDLYDVVKAILNKVENSSSEPDIPTKSSTEILSELFGAFNAEPPKIPERVEQVTENESKPKCDELIKKESEEKEDPPSKVKKGKKNKKKHKHKDKKHKKKSKCSKRGNSVGIDDGRKKKSKSSKKLNSDDSDDGHKKKSKSIKKGSSDDSDDDSKKNKRDTDHKKKKNQVQVKEEQQLNEQEKEKEIKIKPALEPVSVKITTDSNNKVIKRTVECVVSETVISEERPSQDAVEKPSELELPIEVKQEPVAAISAPQPKPAADVKGKPGKIVIKNLKFSSVFEETVRQVEEQAKLKAERYEEGEISDDSSQNKEEEEEEEEEPPLEDEPLELTPERSLVPVKNELRKHSRKHSSDEKHHHHHHRHHKSRSHSKDQRSGSQDRHHSRELSQNKKTEESQDKKNHRSRSKESLHRKRSHSHDSEKHSHSRQRSESQEKTKRAKHSSSVEKSGSKGHSDKSKRSKHSRSHSHSRHRSESTSHTEKLKRSKRSRSRQRSESAGRNDRKHLRRSRSHSRSKRKSMSPGRSDKSKRSRRSRSRDSASHIDKHKLLEIARKNAMNLLKQGVLPSSVVTPDKVVAIKAGGKSVAELTDFCKQLSKKEAMGQLSSDSEGEDHHSSGSDTERPFHHPFQIKERPASIVMNIRNSVQLPLKTLQEKTAEQSKQLRIQFPVSSGQQHRKSEKEWVPVSPRKQEPAALVPVKAVEPKPPAEAPNQVFPPTLNSEGLDIGSIVSQRLTAMRKLQENPNDVQALSEMYRAQKDMQMWAESKQQPGQFTGSTGARVLSAAELASGFQAWAKKDQLTTASPVSGGMGMALLQKMGWRPGEGLGKNKEGTLEPLQLEIKMDKKGLVSQEELGRRPVPPVPVTPTQKSLVGKHPVSLLVEFCSKRRWSAPQFELCFECGPDHRKNFLFKVRVDGVEYKPSVASHNKKQAKAEAATICLQSLGVLPP